MIDSSRIDRLSALVSRFEIDVVPESHGMANLVICQRAQSTLPGRILFAPVGVLSDNDYNPDNAVFLAKANWGGSENPLLIALPDRIVVDIDDNSELQSLSSLLIAESGQQRCGAGSVINRLGEVLLVLLLRVQLSVGTTDSGLLGGLADIRLSPAIVAMHERPGEPWRIERLAEISGLSTSRFADRFTKTVGQTPMSYLRCWRMVLAHRDVQHGDRIQAVAARYGYASSEALSRAFRRHFGANPTALRP
ncbi:helix-turn-helix transcriptional regulator [Granulosicoccus antarcticus]|uniref:RCS-specific HTH-type transcriptional activator RclR n=1 Tax=Granulosicoccus antarcticus IMCC3135 TaxID=1192854 RepID=A0A2Z2NJY2_9GAMM|nr:helix-turn-helix transcriptional regulator [Granulosicoccus antarcticus]ASJ70188.1 RCS-specific HTH-type transcriptional activator RclR [Granulosicoccus antarcticus IMCC3135]